MIQVQEGGVQVVDRGDLLHRAMAELVGRSVAEPPLRGNISLDNSCLNSYYAYAAL